MLKVIEAFSGIGSQAKALNNIGVEYEIVSTIEWDINAIYAYDIIHNGKQDLSIYDSFSKYKLIKELAKYQLSNNGKSKLKSNCLSKMSTATLKRILYAINRTHNLISITDVKATDLPTKVDLLTYSFPCQDLSICGAWHNNMSGINRNAHNRSGLLWEVERILKEYVKEKKKLPKFLLMENVSNILSETHEKNFKEWKNYLEDIGYTNQVYTLDAANFGIPQHRRRTFMISVYSKNKHKVELIEKYFENNNLQKEQYISPQKQMPLKEFLRTDYSINKYRIEADISNPNDTPSRQKIFKDNDLLYDGEKYLKETVKTITTKQDRNPNSGVILYDSEFENKSMYRNLTPRECFLLMGFEESDFQALMDNNFVTKGSQMFFTREKLIKMAGNSIVVNVLESVFKQINEINVNILGAKNRT